MRSFFCIGRGAFLFLCFPSLPKETTAWRHFQFRRLDQIFSLLNTSFSPREFLSLSLQWLFFFSPDACQSFIARPPSDSRKARLRAASFLFWRLPSPQER